MRKRKKFKYSSFIELKLAILKQYFKNFFLYILIWLSRDFLWLQVNNERFTHFGYFSEDPKLCKKWKIDFKKI